MSKLFISLVVADASADGISLDIQETAEGRRLNLIAFFNQCVEDGGLPDGAPILPDNADEMAVCNAVADWMGQVVVLKDHEL